MTSILAFFIILVSGLIFSEIFKRLHLPYVTALILSGILIGPFFLNLIKLDETILFIGSIGLVFLMFIAGSEIKLESFRKTGKEVLFIALLNGLIPFLVGFSIGFIYNFSIMTCLILGTIFVSSSVAVIIPSLEVTKLIDTKIGKGIVSATVFEDIASLILLSILLQSFTQKTPIPIPLYIPLIVLIVIILKLVIPKIQELYHFNKVGRDLFESKLRFVFAVLLATVILFEFIGMHSIVAGFIIGILLEGSIKGKVEEKIRTFSYGLFIPTFFLIIGMQTNLGIFYSGTYVILILTIVLGLIVSKVVSGLLAGFLFKFSRKESLLIGFSTIPQLSTTLAVSFTARDYGLLNEEIITSLVILSIVTTFLAPFMITLIAKDKKLVPKKSGKKKHKKQAKN
jgi:Kef-type K+ transport system membrane component KefB